MHRTRVLIMGAAGRDFHDFNVAFRDHPELEVVGFTATQIPFIEDRTYPPELAGGLYPEGIRIYPEEDLVDLVHRLEVDEVVFAYSDVAHEYVMHKASEVLAAGASFRLLGPNATMLASTIPVVAVSAVRTGCGKSQTTRYLAKLLREAAEVRPVVVRHPMPYGDLAAEWVQRFAALEDLDRAGVTIEEREEYEPHLRAGTVVYAGVDYGAILARAQEEADVLLWDGGNNDFPFYRPDLHIVVTDPLRAGHERRYHPGETNLRMADAVIVNKIDSASPEQVARVEADIRELNPTATVIKTMSPVTLDRPLEVEGKRVLVVEDGPTLTHGGMKFGAGVVAANRFGAAEIVDPRPYAVGTLTQVFDQYDVGRVLPAEGYSPKQLEELEETISATPADVVVIGTPIDLRHLIRIGKPAVRASYDLEEVPGEIKLIDLLTRLL
jgi:predicted GTPase